MYIDASFCENQNLTAPVSCGSKEKKKKNNNFVVPVVASVVGSLLVLLLTAVAVCWGLKRKKKHGRIPVNNVYDKFLLLNKEFF